MNGSPEIGRHCLRCEKQYLPSSPAWTCTDCGANLELFYDYPRIAREWPRGSLQTAGEATMWRYRPLLPIGPAAVLPALAVGGTPLYRAAALGRRYRTANLFLKDDGRNPTGSLKDRASAMAVVHAQAMVKRVLACASTGNAASALAGLAASAGLSSVIFVPEATPSGKLAQIIAFGAYLIRVKGIYDDAFDLAARACRRFGWYNRNTGTNPYLSEGKKTVAFEIAEQLGWRAPDWVFVPVGDGNIIGSVGKGFSELQTLGWIERLPRLVAVQAEGSSAIADALLQGEAVRASSGRTLADGIAVGLPRDPDRALGAVRRSKGEAVKVSDEALLEAQGLLARSTGVFVEPAAAASLAGLLRLSSSGRIAENDAVVLLLTGTGLKSPQAILDRAELPEPIPADLAALEQRLSERPLG
jgi:threonine synthase